MFAALRSFGQDISLIYHEQGYESLPLPSPRHIRLLKLQESGQGLLMRFETLSFHSLDDNLDFDALSYTWDFEAGEHSNEIRVGDGLVKVSRNLYAFLERMYQQKWARLLWVDALCIDQGNNIEKAQQIPLMGEIYSKATSVLAWLGDGNRYEREFIHSIPKIVSELENLEEPTSMEQAKEKALELFEAGILPHLQTHFWGACANVLNREWFNRIWVQQEVMLARDIYVICGDALVQWEKFVAFASILDKHFFSIFLDIEMLEGFGEKELLNMEPKRELRSCAVRTIMLMDSQRQQVIANGKLSSHEIFQLARRKQSTLAVDRVYGLLALMEKSDSSLIIEVDPNATIADAFIQLAKWYAAAALSIKYPLLCEIDNSDSSDSPSGLPSWCPNFSVDRSTCPFSTLRWYYAGLKPGPSPLAIQYLWKDSNVLVLRSMWVDVVNLVSNELKLEDDDQEKSEIAAAAALLAWEDECQRISQATYNRRELLFKHIQTLTAGVKYNLVKRECSDYETTWEIISDYSAWKLEILQQMQGAEEVHPPEGFYSTVLGACVHRKFFSTLEGRTGLGPRGIQSGDEIHVIENCPIPLIFRHVDDGAQIDTWRGRRTVVGEAYVTDLMAGETLEDMKKRSIQWQEFEII